MLNISRNTKTDLRISPWIIVGAAVILIVVVLILAIQNTRRDRKYMFQVLSTKGAALIRALEAGTRTGMMGMMWGGPQVQRMLEEFAQMPDVLYLAVLDAEGRILAHSDPQQIGELFSTDNSIRLARPDFEENWQMVTAAGGRRAFEVRRNFKPLPAGWQRKGRNSTAMMRSLDRSGDSDWFDPLQSRSQLIVIGLDPSTFESSIRGEIRSTIILSIVLMLLGFTGFLSLFWMQSYRLARRNWQDTSAFADEVVSNLPVGLIATDRRGRIAFFNPVAGQLCGIDSSVAMGRDPQETLPSQLSDLITGLDRGRIVREKEMSCTFGDRTIPLSVSAARINNQAGEDVGFILILRDLVEVRRLQAEILRQEKLAALGGLAAGVAHEIRNPLSSIKGLATYFGEKFSPDSEDRKLSRVMIQEVDRLNRVISELLEFARPTDLNRRLYDFNSLLRHCMQLIHQDAADRQITIESRLSDRLCRVDIDPDRLSQCILNLFLNALEAMEKGGCLTVSSEVVDDERVSIQIADNGRGIDPKHIEIIFNPYFTTKPNGTGLGLAIVHKIVEAHGGHIDVESTPGAGTRFTLVFPCNESILEGD